MDSSQINIISSHVLKTLNTMRENEEYCDLVFELNNCKFSAHRLVIAVWSPPLKNLLQFSTVCIQHVSVAYDKPEAFQKFLTFLYTGVLPDEVTHIQAVLHLAATFQIQLLVEMCKEHLKTITAVDNVISMYQLGMKYQLPELEDHCVEFLCRNPIEVAQQQELRNFTPTQINFFLKSEKMAKLDPEIKLFLIISWIADDVPSREQFLIMLLRHIEWNVMAKEFLSEIIETENYFTSNPSSLYLLLQTLHSSSFSLGPYENHFWTLREQYSHLLNSVISSSVVLDSGKPSQFKPLSFSLVSTPSEDPGVIDQNRDTSKILGIKKELQQAVSFDKSDTCIHSDPSSSDLKEASFDIPILDVPTSANANKTLAKNLFSDSMDVNLSPIEISSADDTSNFVESSMRRKCLRPYRIVATSDITKTIQNTDQDKRKKNESKYNTRKQSKSKANERDSLNLENPTKDLQITVLKTKNAKVNKTRKQLPTQRVQRRQNTKQRTSKKTSTVMIVRYIKPDLTKETSQTNPQKEVLVKVDHTSELLKCSECEYETYKHHMLKKHQKQVHEGIFLFCCSLCPFKSKWSKKYYDHLKQSHFPGPPFCCNKEECNFTTDKFPELMSHCKKHGDHRPFVCEICQTAFKSRNNLYQHVKVHSDEKHFECPECARSFKHKNTLEQHMVTHSDLRPYLCDLCGFSTKFQSHLISHKRIHSGDVFHCNFPSCSYTTPKKSQLESHMRSHLGVRRHVCRTCEKAFVEKSHLIRHERTHSSERAYVCKECSYSSTRADKLKEHVQKHHSKEALRTKATTSASKKLDSSRKTKEKNPPKTASHCKDGINTLVTNPDSLLEVVPMRIEAPHPRSSDPTFVKIKFPNILTAPDINARLLQVSPFQPSVPHNGTISTGYSLPLVPVEENINTGNNNTTKAEIEVAVVEVVARSGLPSRDMARVIDSTFEYQVHPGIVGAAGDMQLVSSVGNQVIMADSSRIGDQTITVEETQTFHMQNTSLAVPSYSQAISAPQLYSKPSTHFQHILSIPQQTPKAVHGSHQHATMTTVTPSMVANQYHSQQDQNLRQPYSDHVQHQQTQGPSHFANVGDYLY